jgi:superfamily I DNA/RNA helicase
MRSGKFAGYGDFAVHYRGHRIGDALETELVQAEIPVYRVEGERFLHDRKVQESLRYLELAYGLFDRGFEPALSWPRMMVDEATMVHLRRWRSGTGCL